MRSFKGTLECLLGFIDSGDISPLPGLVGIAVGVPVR